MFRYDWIWEKEQGANFMLCKYQPYKVHEIISVFSKKRHCYFPQMTEGKPYTTGTSKPIEVYGGFDKREKRRNEYGLRYPRSIQRFNRDKSGKHPTIKPVELLEYLIKTYTLEGEIVLDFTMGSGSTGVACVNTNRSFIGFEKEPKYYDIAKQRINDAATGKKVLSERP